MNLQQEQWWAEAQKDENAVLYFEGLNQYITIRVPVEALKKI